MRSLRVIGPGGSMQALLMYVGLGVVGIYVLSLLLHPYVPCERCRRRGGTTREYGLLFSRSYRPCWVCSGTGTKQRFGAQMLGIGTPRSPRYNGKFAPATKHGPTPNRSRIFGIF